MWLIALATPAGWIAGAAYLLVLISICVMDYFAVPGPDEFQIQRDIGRFSLGAVTDVHIQMRKPVPASLHISMRDELPPALYQLTPIRQLSASGAW